MLHSQDGRPSNLGAFKKKAPNPLHALRIIQLPVVNLRIIPSGRRLIDVKVSLDLPVDIDHRAIGAMVRDQDFDLRGPVLLYRSAGNAVPGKKRKPSVSVAKKKRGGGGGRHGINMYVCMYIWA